MKWNEVIAGIQPTDKAILKNAQHKIDAKTKPLGSLGIMEEMAVKMAVIQNTLKPAIRKKGLFVFAGDHGIAAEGVSAFPPEVTPQMVMNFLAGGAGINVLCRHYGIDIAVVDMGVNFDFAHTPHLIQKKVRKGTRNFLKENAMTEAEAIQALQNGMDAFLESHQKTPFDIIGLGDMGIGNTASSSAIISAITGLPASQTTGKGTGVSDERLQNKIAVLEQALASRKPDPKNGLDVLQKVGGFEIAGIAGAVLAAAHQKVPVMLDGIISTAGGLIAYQLNPAVGDYLFSGHKSIEHGQQAALKFMGLNPIVDLRMRLGEGTGAAVAIDLAEASCTIMREMASFEDAGVSGADL